MKVGHYRVRVVLAILLVSTLAILNLHLPLRAQSFYGSLVGTVVDASGAVVPGATVTITNAGTNEKRTMDADSSGKYSFVNLVPANYRVEVTKASFKRFVREGVAVQVGQATRIDPNLEVGSANETIEVTTTTPLLQTESSSQSQAIEGAQVQQIPLNGRNIMNLIALAPGVVPAGSASGGAAMNQNGSRTSGGIGWGNFQIGGGIQGLAAQYIDGAPDNILGGSAGGNGLSLIPTQDAIQEFNVASSNAGADFGRYAGGVVNMTTRSGTNAFHGSAYEYLRNAAFNANNFFSNRTGTSRVKWNQNQYGANISGPIKRDKIFFLFTWEGFKISTQTINSTNVPTANLQAGIFNTTTLTDPTGAVPGSANSCLLLNTPQVGQTTIKSSCLDPTNQVLKLYYPAPNQPAGSATNWFGKPSLVNNQNQYNGRIDASLTQKQRVFGRYSYWNTQDKSGLRFLGLTADQCHCGGGGGNITPYFVHQVALGHTYTLNSSTVTDVRVSYTRETSINVPYLTNWDESQFGPQYATLAPQMTVKTGPVYQVVGPRNFFSMLGFQGVFKNWWNNYAITGSMVKIMGPHSLKFGTELRLMDDSAFPNSNHLAGQYLYSNSSAYGNDEWAAFLMGYPNKVEFQASQTNGNYTYYKAFYAMDTWQVTRSLTLNLGLRYEMPGAVAERKDRSTVLLPDAVDPYTGVKGTLSLVNSSLYGNRNTVLPANNLFAPRVGMAYRATSNTVVRAGYGISYLPNDIEVGTMPWESQVNQALTTYNLSTPVQLQTVLSCMAGSLSGSACTKTNVSQPGLIQPVGRTQPDFMLKQGLASLTSYKNQVILAPVPFQTYPRTQQWNVALSHQFKGDFMAEAAYVGLHGSHLPGIGTITNWPSTRNLNQIRANMYTSAGIATTGPQAGQSLAAVATSCPAAPGLVGTSPTFYVGQCLKPNPYYNNLQDTAQFIGNQNYRSIQLKAEKRFGAAGVLMANYTWAKNYADTDQQGVNQFVEGAKSIGFIQDFNNPGGEYSLISYDATNRTIINYVLKMPFGKGQKYANNLNGVANVLASGWGFNGITTFQSGFPLTFTTSVQNQLAQKFGAGITRPNMVAGCNANIGGSGLTRVNAGSWFNPSCFQYPGDYAFGNEPRVDPQLRTDGIKNFDVALQKSTSLHEAVSLDFRAEFFNIFNRVQFGPPVTLAPVSPTCPIWSPGANATNSACAATNTFGQVTTQVNNPRQIQLSLRLNY
jgi:hypothetical protein